MNDIQPESAESLAKENTESSVNQETTTQGQQVTQPKIGKLSEEEEYKFLKKPFPIKLVIVGSIISLGLIGLTIYALILPKVRQRPKDFNPTPVQPEANVPFNPDATYNWKVYQSKVSSFEFKYPNSWSLQEAPLQLMNTDGSLVIAITQADSNVLQTEYCGQHLEQKPRCLQVQTKNALAVLDTQTLPGKKETAVIIPSKGSLLKVTLETSARASTTKIISDDEKSLFFSFITTFKFTQ